MGKKIALFISLIAVILLMTAAGLLVYFRGKDFPFLGKVVAVPILEPSSADMLVMARKNLAGLTTAHYDLNVAFKNNLADNPYTIDSQVVFDGGFGESLIGQLSMKNQITLRTLSFLMETEGLFTPEKYYFRIVEVPALPYVDMASVAGQWYETAVPKNQAAALAAWSGFLVNMNFLNIDGRLPDETVGGRVSYHLAASPDQSGLDSLWQFLKLSDQTIAASHYIKSLYATKIDLWIDKKDNYLVKMNGHSQDGTQTTDFILNISKFDEKVTVETPMAAEPLDQLAVDLSSQTNFFELPLFANMFGLDTKILAQDSDGDDLFSIWENIIGTDPNKADTDSDGYADGVELRHGYNPKGSGKLFAL